MRITGRVVSPDGNSLPGAVVQYFAPGSTRNSGAQQTDADGRFALDTPGNGSIQITFIGYKPKTYKVGEIPFIVIMQEETYHIGPAEVVGKKDIKIPWIIVGPLSALLLLVAIKKAKS
jgi:hypothetical protein